MRARGINYDTGFLPDDSFSRPLFDPAAVRTDIAVIADELGCDAVRISGREPGRLTAAAEIAAEHDLEIWFSPFPVDLGPDEMLAVFAECAHRAEELRRHGARITLVTGCEISAFGKGFMPGETYGERMRTMATADMEWWQSLGPIIERLDVFLAEVATIARQTFGGPLTYASAPWEPVDWSPFDIVGLDAYRASYNATTFRDELLGQRRHGKPLAVLEFGTCAYRGASDLGGMAWMPPAGAVPDEGEQARYYTDLMADFEAAGVDTALWFTFASFTRIGPADLSSYGVVRMVDATTWEPKEVFHAMAAANGEPRSPGLPVS
ncbi:hypothetical protein [Herbidospora mongoliensis]|uniref:hypothetical protein n=1 Tax=Herbidospora mongoliensis TaxID=688067 RepID=UPI00082FF1BE|nr:hypothetical protein [Herbidospora mongoliensis]